MPKKWEQLNAEADRLLAERQRKVKENQDRETLNKAVSQTLTENFAPLLQTIADNSKVNKEELVGAVSQIKIEAPQVNVNVPDINIPDVIVPEIKIPDINVPEIKIPEIKVPKAEVDVKIPKITVPKPEVNVEVKSPKIEIPKTEFPKQMKVDGEVSLKDVDKKNPLPVTLFTEKGEPFQMISGGGGGSRIVKIDNESLENLATESTLQAVLAASGGTPAIIYNDLDGSGNLLYKGTNTNADAADGDSDWKITKYIYVGGLNTQKITKTGSWTDRVSLF